MIFADPRMPAAEKETLIRAFARAIRVETFLAERVRRLTDAECADAIKEAEVERAEFNKMLAGSVPTEWSRPDERVDGGATTSDGGSRGPARTPVRSTQPAAGRTQVSDRARKAVVLDRPS